MVHRILIFFIFLIYISYLINPGIALEAEFLVGGEEADGGLFLHQVLVLGRKNFSITHIPVCGGGIVGPKFVLSAAHCYIELIGYLKLQSFVVFAGTTYAYEPEYTISVEIIYLAPYDEVTHINDLAVLKLKREFGYLEYVNWKKLTLPTATAALTQLLARVAGFGINKNIKYQKNLSTNQTEISDGSSDNKLKMAQVEILDDGICALRFPSFDAEKQLCTRMIPKPPAKTAGICMGDSGNALVIENTVIGIAGESTPDCNDTNVGCLYTKVSYYVKFIEAIIGGEPLLDTYIYYNRPYRLN